MSKLFCITDLIRFMMKEAENLMKGSVHEDDFFIVHDALVLMKAKETIKWSLGIWLWIWPLALAPDLAQAQAQALAQALVFPQDTERNG